ncbi:hypothetical protein A3K72_01640 [Candidatus Woesearchaeota archaeon RBG_13_36_6]|nr:MAG: hypothetical protein A3K72_01640 [Candidatus Woesearchaeota archaeon RBG_13_36_6]
MTYPKKEREKANKDIIRQARKLKLKIKTVGPDNKAVSAIIGVILMIAITVAIAATVYVYVSDMVSKDWPCNEYLTEKWMNETGKNSTVGYEWQIRVDPNDDTYPKDAKLYGRVTILDADWQLLKTGIVNKDWSIEWSD